MIEQTAVETFMKAVGSADWNMSFVDFCKKTGFVGEYAERKWEEFKKINLGLRGFDPETLTKILN